MRIICRHGHYAFYPRRASEIGKFCDYFGVVLDRENDYYTFPELIGLARYSITGKSYLNQIANVTFEGRGPWDVLKANGFVYHVDSELLLPKSSIVIQIRCPIVGNFFLSPAPLIQAGSRNEGGHQILSYDAEWDQNVGQLKVTEFAYE